MLSSGIPIRFPIPFANGAGGGFVRVIPEASQVGVQSGAASLTDGFPPVCFDPVAAGGVPPFGQDFNGILKQVSQWAQWQAAGAPVPYNASFAASILGYPAGATLASTTVVGYFWLNLVDGNQTDPDAGGANWIAFSPLGGTTGDWKWRPTDEDLVSSGWVRANGTTIGNASSNATQLASSLAAALFSWLWTNFSNTKCQVLTSGGVPTTRGATAAADFSANKQITVLDLRGTGVFGVDAMGSSASGRLAGVPVTDGGVTTPGSIVGANLQALLQANLPSATLNTAIASGQFSHNHSYSYRQPVDGTGDTGALASGAGTTFGTRFVSTETLPAGVGTTPLGGSNTAHNTVDRVMLGSMYFRL